VERALFIEKNRGNKEFEIVPLEGKVKLKGRNIILGLCFGRLMAQYTTKLLHTHVT
jgi:hypothetical protein